MAEPVTPGHDPTVAVCPWCSAALQPDVTICPSCGASLVADGDPNVPGVTTVAAKPIVTSKATTQPRNRLLAWISGDYPEDIPSHAEVQAIAPPDLDVRREILRLELEAEVANLQAEAEAIRADAAVEGQTVDLPEIEPAGNGEAPAAAEDKPPA
jgi:hypothetical protein